MIIVDTGYLLALADRSDAHHRRAVECLPSLDEGWITTWPVLTEATHLLTRRMNPAAAAALIEDVAAGACAVWSIPAEQAAEVATLMRRHAKLPMDLADASLVLLAAHLGHGRILSTDTRDFRTYRFKNHRPFTNLMEPL